MKVPLTIRDFFSRAEQVYGDRIGVVDEPDPPGGGIGNITWNRFGELGRAQAARLDDLGIGQGERVAMVSLNSGRQLVSFLGVSGYGRIFVPINFRLNKDEINYIVGHSGASMLLYDPELADVCADLNVKHKLELGSATDDELFLEGVEPEPWTPDEDTTATINYTSGTTARPKGVEQTHRALWINATTFGWHSAVDHRDTYLHTLPQFHCNGWGMPYAVAGMGGTQIVLRKVDGAEILRRVQEHGVTLLCGAPAVVAAILDAAPNFGGEVPGAGVTRMVVAGAPPPTSTIERVETELGWEFIQIYGLTETAPLLTMNRCKPEWDGDTPTQRAKKLSRAGAPAIGVQVDVDSSGEVMARANVVLEGYWEQPEATAAAIRDGWFYTGDGGSLDAEHYITISDRKKDVIISGGENVSSFEVEDVLFGHPAIAEVAVIGVPDEKWGETVKALVVTAPGATASEPELIEYCRERLAHFKCPTSIEVRDELARTATGKLQKFKLREPYWEGFDKAIN